MAVRFVRSLLNHLSLSIGEDRHYWHMTIRLRNGRFMLRMLGGADGPDLTQYLLRQQKALET